MSSILSPVYETYLKLILSFGELVCMMLKGIFFSFCVDKSTSKFCDPTPCVLICYILSYQAALFDNHCQ